MYEKTNPIFIVGLVTDDVRAVQVRLGLQANEGSGPSKGVAT